MSDLLIVLITLITYPVTEKTEDIDRFHEITVATDPGYDNYFQAGISRLANGDLEGSITLFERVKHVIPAAHYYLGVAHYRLDDFGRAVHHFESFYRIRSDIWQSCYYLSLIYLKQNNIGDAMDYLQYVPDIDGKQRLANFVSGYKKLDEAQRRYAETQYEEAIELYHQVDGFFGYREMGLALAYAKLGEHEKSLALLDTIIGHSSDDTLMLWGLFEASKELVLLKNQHKAKQYLREYLSLVPDDNARFLMGKLLSDEAKFDSARIYFRDLPDSVDEFLFFKGRTEYFLGLWAKSEVCLLRHRELFPESSYADRTLYILASINYKRKEYHNALDFWRQLVDFFPKSSYVASALQGIGNSYFNMGEYSNALSVYYSVAQFHPSPEISDEVALRIYETKYHLKEHPSLVDALRRYVRQNPDSRLVSKASLRIAKILYDMNRYYQSMSELDRIIEDKPSTTIMVEALILRVQVSQAINSRHEVLNSLRSLLMNEDVGEYRLYAANELGALWFEELRYDSALYYYNLLLDSDRYRENAIIKIASIYAELEQNKESVAMVERLISEYPKSTYLADAYLLKSRALRSQGDYNTATSILLDLVEKVSDRADVYMEIGDLYFETEEFLSARENYLKACEVFKQNREDAALALILAGDASVAIGDSPSGREYYLQANMIAESHVLKNRAMQKLSALTEE